MPLKLDVLSTGFTDLFAQNATLEAVAEGFEFTEGPVWSPKDHTLIFSDIIGNTIYRWSPEFGTSVFRQPSNMANGNTYSAAGDLLTCEHATSRVVRARNGDIEVLASHYLGKELNSPNDIVVHSSGDIYFTDPTSGRIAPWGVPREPELDVSGVYRIATDGSLTLLVDDFSKPNGLCFSLDESQLYVNDTNLAHIRVFDVDDGGNLANGRIFAELEGDRTTGVADGMKFDAAGVLYSCGPGGIHVFSLDGTRLGRILMPEKTANFCWGDADLRSLYITASTRVYRIRVSQPGIAVL